MSEQPEKLYILEFAKANTAGITCPTHIGVSYNEAVENAKYWLRDFDIIRQGYWFGTKTGVYLGRLVPVEVGNPD